MEPSSTKAASATITIRPSSLSEALSLAFCVEDYSLSAALKRTPYEIKRAEVTECIRLRFIRTYYVIYFSRKFRRNFVQTNTPPEGTSPDDFVETSYWRVLVLVGKKDFVEYPKAALTLYYIFALGLLLLLLISVQKATYSLVQSDQFLVSRICDLACANQLVFTHSKALTPTFMLAFTLAWPIAFYRLMRRRISHIGILRSLQVEAILLFVIGVLQLPGFAAKFDFANYHRVVKHTIETLKHRKPELPNR